MSLSTLLFRFVQLAIVVLLIMACETEGTTPTPSYSLSTAASPTAGGRITTSPSGSSFTEGQSVTLTPEANANWIFSHWEGAASGSASPLTVTMNANKSVTGIFVKREYPLTITVEGQGTVNEVIVTNPAGREYPHGTTVELTPIPTEGWVFESWGGDLSGSEVPKRITVDAEKNVTAKFKIREYPLTITIEGEGTVTEEVVTNPAGRNYPQGTIVELTPIPAEGWVFDSWSGDLTGNETPKRITVDGERNVTAKFKIREYPLTITIEGEGTVTEEVVTNPAGRDYPQGTIVELTPVPAEGWVFESWSGDLTGSEVPKRITVDGEKNVTIIFKEQSTGLFYLAENGITCKCEGASPGDKGFIDGVEYEAVDNELIRKRRDEEVDMTRLCTSLVTDMSALFYLKSQFNQPIGNWDLGNVTEIWGMFSGTLFNQPIGEWNVSKVTNMASMFSNSNFNQPIEAWNVSKVTNMAGMFFDSRFNQPIGNWNVGNVTNMISMFSSSHFNQPIGDWNVSEVTYMESMFSSSHFNQPIGDWDVSQVTNMNGMFVDSPFNQPIGDWDVGNVTDMEAMFIRSQFNQSLGNWNVGKVTNMEAMFLSSSFNQDIGGWEVSNVTNMSSMFYGSPFDQPIGNWDVSEVTDMGNMFDSTPFNQPIGNWNVAKVTNMESMFRHSPFNQPIGNWNVSNVKDVGAMFWSTPFNQSLGDWDVSEVTYMAGMFVNSPFDQPIGNWDVSNVSSMASMFANSNFNQDIGDWNVRNVTNMLSMFARNSKFNQDLSKWCVIQIPILPNDFQTEATAWVLPKPVWGSCPE